MHSSGLLSIVIWVPIVGGLGTLALGDGRASAARWTALITSLLTLAVCVPLYLGFANGTANFQFVERVAWIPALHAQYYLGVDGISLPLILLTAFVTPPVVIAGWTVIERRPAQYFASFLIMEGLMIGVFAALDGLLFYFFWEAMLIPMFLIIGVWGGPRRVYATLKFFLYTFLGSVLMLVALIYLYEKTGNYTIAGMQQLPLTLTEQRWIFLAFLLAFAVKVPMWPVHTWLPDAHVEAPTGGSVILAAIMLKMGGYGLLRFSLPITPDASRQLDWLILVLSLIAIVYIAFVALVQTDMKKLIAYSSIAHMGFVTLGAFLVFFILAATGSAEGAVTGMDGAQFQMVSHGLISGALFLCVGVMYDRLHTREIGAYGGVINVMPQFAAFMVLFALANSGLPGTSGFVGEFLVILTSFRASFWYALLAATILILGAAYNLWLVKRVIFGPVANDKVAHMESLNPREFLVLGVLALSVLFLGVWPAPLLNMMDASMQHLVQQVVVSKLPGRIDMLAVPQTSLLPALPEICLASSACLVLLIDAYATPARRGLTATITMLALLVGVLVTSAYGMVPRPRVLFEGMYIADPLGTFLKLVGFAVMATVIFYSQDYLEERDMRGGEYYVLCLTALLGIFVLISANNLITVYLGIELLSLSLYALVAFDRDSGIAAEAAIKYFVLGAIASGVLLYGMSMLYGLTGTLDLDLLSRAVRHGPDAGLVIGVAMVVVAVAFKFGAVPFHMWVPDVYQGAPTSVTLYIAAVSTLGSFALILRLVAHGLANLPDLWTQMVAAVAVLSLLLGNLTAIAQTNLKRMLAYSAIANAGFVLLGFATGRAAGYQAALNFTIAYVLTTLAAFGVVLMLARRGFEHDEIADFKGLAVRDPLLAVLMLVLMFSTAGVPPFVGFWAKLWIIQALLGSGHLWLATFAVLISVVGAYYYLRVVWYMYFEPATGIPPAEPRGRMRLILVINTAAVVLLGFLPNALLALCTRVIR